MDFANESTPVTSEVIVTTLLFRDEKLNTNAEFVCARWTEENQPSTSRGVVGVTQKCARICAPIDDTFFLTNDFSNLIKLDLCQEAFRHGELITLSEELIFELPNLKCLNITLLFPTISWIYPEEEEIRLNKNGGQNFVTFLRLLSCPRLSSFHLKTNEEKHRESNWEVEIFDFLKSKSHLKILDLTLGNALKRQENLNPFVAGLHRSAPLQVLFIQYRGEAQYRNKPQQIPNYWTLLLSQSHLKYIDLCGLQDISVNDIEFLARQNQNTLNVLRYHFVFCGMRRRFEFDLESLSSCLHLEELTFNPGMCDRLPRMSKSTVLNVQLLPISLTKLKLSNINLETDALKLLERLENLKLLQLIHCGCGEGYGVSVDALLDLFHFRSLDKLIALPIVVCNSEEASRLNQIEKELKTIEPDTDFLRHLHFYHGEEPDESLSFLFRYCPIV